MLDDVFNALYNNIEMIARLLKKLSESLRNTGSRHKKKLIFTFIMLLGVYVAKKRINTQHIINIVMFFVKFWSNVMNLLPLPKFLGYRDTTTTFQYQFEVPIQQLADLMNLNPILAKIKRKQSGSIQQLKFSILSGITISFILYNAQSFYNLVLKKYIGDFSELGAHHNFQKAIYDIKQKFKTNFKDAKQMIQTTLYSMIKSIQISSVLDITDIECMFTKLMNGIFEQTENKNSFTKHNHILEKNQIQFKRAHNYFQTTSQFAEPLQQQNNAVKKTLSIIFKPLSWAISGFSKITEVPECQIADKSYFCHQYLYLLPLKKYRNQEQWPNLQSKYLSSLVIDEIEDFYRSTNFCTFSRLRAQHIMQIFINRVRIYFFKRVGCQKKRLLDLLPIFSKILKEQLLEQSRNQELYERQISSAIRDTKVKPKSTHSDLAIRNKILIEVFNGNQLRYVDRDMQIKYFNERQNILVKPRQKIEANIGQNDELQEFLQSYDKANDQAEPKQMIQRLKSSLV